MIIKRKYCTYGQLLSDPVTKLAIQKIYKDNNVSEDRMEEQLAYVRFVHVFNTEMGSGIPGVVYGAIKDVLEALDATNPFDNDLDYQDVRDVICFSNDEGNEMTQVLLTRSYDGTKYIVQVIGFAADGKSIQPIEPDYLPHITGI